MSDQRSTGSAEADRAGADGTVGDDADGSARRRFLRTAGAAAISMTIAGCEHDTSDSGGTTEPGTTTEQKPLVTRSKQASPVGVTRQGVLDLGYPVNGGFPASTETTPVIYRGTNKDYSYTLTEHRFILNGGTIPLEVVASPPVIEEGDERNPVLAAPLKEHATKRRFDIQWLTTHSPLSGSNLEYKFGPRSYSSTSYTQQPAIQLFNASQYPYEAFRSVVGPKNSADRSDAYRVHHLIVRTAHGGDGVLIGAAVVVPYNATVPEDRLDSVMKLALPEVTRNVPSSFPSPDTAIADERLVQVVSESTVVNRNPEYVADEPALVVDDPTAPLFGVEGSSHPFRIHFQISGGTFDQFDIERRNLGGGGLADVARLLDKSRSSLGPTVDPFPMFQNLGDVTIDAEAPCGHEVDTATISASDYSVASKEPMRVGFIPVANPTPSFFGGYGQTSRYEETVDLAVEYLRRVYPGDLYAYRHDNAFTGNYKVQPPAANYLPYLNDAGEARNMLERYSSNVTTSPPVGQLYAPDGSRSAASIAIRNRGFNAWVMITPDGYYRYHELDADGMTAAVPKDDSVTPYNWYAATAVERAGRGSDISSAQLVAHELGHFFSEGDLYRIGPSDHPLAQRDDRGQQNRINGQPVDYAHARNTNSGHIDDGMDNDGDGDVDERDEVEDPPGIESLCFDFTDDTFRFIRTFEMNPLGSNVTDPGFLPNVGSPEPTNGPARLQDTIESYMSYRDGRSLWTDARFQQTLIRGDWSQATPSELVFWAQGRPDEEAPEGEPAPLTFDTVRVGEVGARLEDSEGPVEVSLRSPSGEVLSSRSVPDTVTVSEDGVEVTHVSVSLPFPALAVEFRADREGRTTRVNAIVAPIRDAVDRVPPRGFRDDPDEARGMIEERLGVVERAMAEGEYGRGAEELRTLPGLFDEVLREYDALANQPTRVDLRDLVARMAERLFTVADAASR